MVSTDGTARRKKVRDRQTHLRQKEIRVEDGARQTEEINGSREVRMSERQIKKQQPDSVLA